MIMKLTEIREISTAYLADRIQAEQASYQQMLLNHAVSPLENSSQMRTARRNIARLKTVLRQRELNK